MVGGICSIFEKVIAAIGIFDVFDKDLYCFTIDNVLLGIAFGEILFIIFILKVKTMLSLHILIKKTKQYYLIFLFVLEMLFIFKCQKTKQYVICFLEFLLLFLLLDCENSKVYKYGYEKTVKNESNYEEKPVIGREMLTNSQCAALDQLKNIMDKRNSFDSFNIALIGAWGSGKTSITDTLIYEYEQDNEPYFILKIGILTLKETKNVVTYVKNYFENLFKKYEIGIARQNVAFLTSLSRVFSEKISMGNLFENINDSGFFDLENEKELFIKQVSKLLKKSNKKNIIFIIDDTDRNEDKEQIIKLLAEFASINGIISIILLDKSEDVLRKTALASAKEEIVYNPLDKYIHIRIRIENDNRVEYDKNVSKQIWAGYSKIFHEKYCYIECGSVFNEVSLFSETRDYQTTEIEKIHFYKNSKNNILTELFIENLQKESLSFGEYFEKIINEYIYKSIELRPYMEQLDNCPQNMWNPELYVIYAQWIEKMGDWIQQLASNVMSMYTMLCMCLTALDDISKQEIKKNVHSLAQIYNDWHIKQISQANSSVDDGMDIGIFNSQIDQIGPIVFGKEQYKVLNIEVKQGNYIKVKKIIIEKIYGVENLAWMIMNLKEFVKYIRRICNNYRTLKITLREAELLNIDYLKYIIDEWQPSDESQKIIDAMRKLAPDLEGRNHTHLPLISFINNVLFETYISDYGNRKEKLINKRAYLYRGKGETIVVVSGEQKKLRESIFLKNSGEVICDISKILSGEEWQELEKINTDIWN